MNSSRTFYSSILVRNEKFDLGMNRHDDAPAFTEIRNRKLTPTILPVCKTLKWAREKPLGTVLKVCRALTHTIFFSF